MEKISIHLNGLDPKTKQYYTDIITEKFGYEVTPAIHSGIDYLIYGYYDEELIEYAKSLDIECFSESEFLKFSEL